MQARWFVVMGMLLVFAGCGGGGGGGGSTPAPAPDPGVASDFDQGIFRPFSVYENLCAAPRSGADFSDEQGTVTDENNWLRSWSHDLYLWYDEIEDVDPASVNNQLVYFNLMKTSETTPDGTPKDLFHFAFDTEEWQELSQSGDLAGYGMHLVELISGSPTEIVVAYVVPGTPAAQTNQLVRGTRILEVDGVDVINATSDEDLRLRDAALFPLAAGETHTFRVSDFDGSNERTLSLTSVVVSEDPVLTTNVFNRDGSTIGYLLFNEHIATAERELFDAVTDFSTQGVDELVLDIRYNGGGFLDIANELAYMIAGSAAEGRVFETLRFNDKHPNVDPVMGDALTPGLFHTTAQGFSVEAGTPLPTLDLNRVVVLAGLGTCSASESIINSLRGIDVEVVLIGEPTCGEPYGSYATDNCGITYFTIQFQGTNAKGYGDYTGGFQPTQAVATEPAEVPGCLVDDDFTHGLGDPDEGLLGTALQYIASGSCPSPAATAAVVAARRAPVAGPPAAARRLAERIPGRVLP